MKKKDRINSGNSRATSDSLTLDLAAAEKDQQSTPKPHPPEDCLQRHITRFRTISDLTAADPSRIRTLAGAFVKANDIDLQQLRHLYKMGDRAELRQLAHRIKGAAQMTGDTQLVHLCSKLGVMCDDPQVTVSELGVCVRNVDCAMCEFGDSCQRMALEISPSRN